jgi:ubiquinone/menaquinone biosynthesis C-methylase UbiE
MKSNRQQFDHWDSVEYCKKLQARWGSYENFEMDKHAKKYKERQTVIKALKLFLIRAAGCCGTLMGEGGPWNPEKSEEENLLEADPMGFISILEVGCGCGNWLWIAKYYSNKLIGLDYSKHMRRITRKEFAKRNRKVETIGGTCWDIPLKDNEVDVSFQIDVCMHVGGSWDSIKEMIRVSRRGVFFTGPSFEPWTDDVMDHKVRKLSDHGMYWGVSYKLVNKKLDELKEAGKIRSYHYEYREPTDVYKHKILVVEI